MFSWRRFLSILTSRIVVFFTISSSSDSLNFLIATFPSERPHINRQFMAAKFKLTDFVRLFVARHEDLAVGAFTDHALQFVLLKTFHFLLSILFCQECALLVWWSR